MKHGFYNLTWIFGLVASMAWAAHESPPSFTLDGTLKNSGGAPLLDTTAKVRVQILNPTKTCVLYDEEQTVDTSATNGHFNIQVGSAIGALKRKALDSANAMASVYQNASAIPAQAAPSQTCAGSSYTPAAGDIRYVRVIVTPTSSSPETLSPDMILDSAPSAIVAQSLQGVEKAGFIQVNPSALVTQAKLEQFMQTLTTVPGVGVAYDGTNFVSYDPKNGGLLNAGTVTDTQISDVEWSKVTSVPPAIAAVAGLACANGEILKFVSGSWACGTESGVGVESDPTVSIFAKTTPGAGLTVDGSNHLVPDFGTGAGKVAQGNDSRFTDSRAPNGAASGDLSGTYPSPTVAKLQGRAVSTTAPVDGQVLRYDNGTSTWTPVNFGIDDLKTSIGGAQFISASCLASQTLIWSAVTDTFQCTNIILPASQLTGLAAVETDPKVGANTTNYLSKWNGSALVASGVFENAGSVGIGTTTPSSLLDLSAATPELTISGSSAGYHNGAVVFKATNSTNSRGLGMYMHDLGGQTEWFAGRPYWPSGSDSFVIARKSSTASHDQQTSEYTNANFIIKSSGNVGIGTTSPGAKLEVAGQVKITGGSPGAGKVLTSDADGLATWTAPAAGGSVTSVATGAGLSGGTITTTGTISLTSIANNNVLANVSGSSAAPSATTLTSLIDNAIGSTQGSILYRNNSSWVALTPGTSGHVLKTQGAAANPVWAADSNSGGTITALTGDVTASGTGSVAATIANNAVTNAKFRQGTARSVVGVTGNATANVADIQGTANQVLRIDSAGTGLTFGSINLASSAAVTGTLPIANGGTGSTTGSITGSGALNFAAGGTNQNVTLTPSGTGHTLLNGRVGVGTSSPAAKLDVSGTIRPAAATAGGACTPLGAQAYDSTTGAPLYCSNAAVWTAVGGGGSGVLVKHSYAESATYQALTTVIPVDDTIPQITEGTEIITLTVTPSSATNRLKFRVFVPMSMAGSEFGVVALFRDSTANALSSVQLAPTDNTFSQIMTLEYEIAAGSTAATTFRVRMGPRVGTMYINGFGAARKMGGTQRVTFTIDEFTP